MTTNANSSRILEIATLAAHDPGQRGFAASAKTQALQVTAETLLTGSRVVIATGFCIRAAMIGENDGPPGALALADALAQLGQTVTFVTDRFSSGLLEAGGEVYGLNAEIIELAQEQGAADRQILDLLDTFQPSHVVAIERPGSALDGHRYSMRGEVLDDLAPAADLLLV